MTINGFYTMKKYILFLLLFGFAISISAQSRRPKPPKQEFLDKLWVGINLNDLRFGSGSFSFGLSPMVAYEVTENFSMGLMLKADYFYQRLTFNPPHIKFESLDFGPDHFCQAGCDGQVLSPSLSLKTLTSKDLNVTMRWKSKHRS